MAASTSALPPLTCTARDQPSHLRLVVCCKAGHLWAVCFEACAGRRIRWLCLPAVPVQQAVSACSGLFCGLFGCLPLCLPCPLPSSTSCFAPFTVLCLPCSFHVLQDRRVRASSLPAARLSRWQLQHGPAVAARAPGPFLLFPTESMILGHGFSVNL